MNDWCRASGYAVGQDDPSGEVRSEDGEQHRLSVARRGGGVNGTYVLRVLAGLYYRDGYLFLITNYYLSSSTPYLYPLRTTLSQLH